MPVDVRADSAACDIQFGHVMRPTHASTNWDATKFEVCAHRWVDISEHGYGVALLNDCKHGHDLHRGALRLTLLRAANFPDPDADRGEHHFTYALLPHLGGLADGGVIDAAAALNQPLVAIRGGAAGAPVPGLEEGLTAVSSSNPSVVVTAVKLAADGSGDIIVRCYESAGGRASTRIDTAFAPRSVVACDLLEHPLADVPVPALDDDAIVLELRPFQIVTLRIG